MFLYNTDAGGTFGAAGVVFRRRERVLDLAVGEYKNVVAEYEVVVFVLKAAAVEAHAVVFLAKNACKLVHNAALDADVFVF